MKLVKPSYTIVNIGKGLIEVDFISSMLCAEIFKAFCESFTFKTTEIDFTLIDPSDWLSSNDFIEWEDTMEDLELLYNHLKDKGNEELMINSVLPLGSKTEFTCCETPASWFLFFAACNDIDEDMPIEFKTIFEPLRKEMQEKHPYFKDNRVD